MIAVVLAFTLALAAASAYAQSADDSTSFEVASVRRSAMLEGGRMGAQPGGRFVMVNGTAQTLISFAYNLRLDELIVGAPEWTRAETYDVNAKASNPAPSLDQMRLMVRTLLGERFNLRATHTQEERPIYRLVLARRDRLRPGCARTSPPGRGYFTYEIEYEPIGFDRSDREPSKLPSIFTALQEQLGLRLDAARAPVDVLVIDRIERPTPD